MRDELGIKFGSNLIFLFSFKKSHFLSFTSNLPKPQLSHLYWYLTLGP